MKIAIVDYEMGNVCSIIGALKHVGVGEISVTDEFAILSSADRLILPGVGSFAKAMKNIQTF